MKNIREGCLRVRIRELCRNSFQESERLGIKVNDVTPFHGRRLGNYPEIVMEFSTQRPRHLKCDAEG